jgi:hypothetical protein
MSFFFSLLISFSQLYAWFAVVFGIVMMVICMYSTIQYNNFVPPGCNATLMQ